MSIVKYPVDVKDIDKFEHQKTLVLISVNVKIKKSSFYVLPQWALQEIALIYYISLLVKHLIMYC